MRYKPPIWNYLAVALSYFFSVYGVMVFLVGMFLVFPFVFIASFFGKERGGNLIYAIGRFWTDVSFILWGIYHKNIFEAPYDKNKQYVFVANHISYMDIPVIIKTIRKQRFRPLGKFEASKIPVFGYMYKRSVVMVDRSTNAGRAASVRELKNVIESGISVFLFPEGTFNEIHEPLLSFYDGAFKIAIETQTPVKPILFLDTYDRLNYTNFFSLTPGRSRSVFLEEVPVAGLTINDVPLLKEKVHRIMEERLISYKAAWIKTV